MKQLLIFLGIVMAILFGVYLSKPSDIDCRMGAFKKLYNYEVPKNNVDALRIKLDNDMLMGNIIVRNRIFSRDIYYETIYNKIGWAAFGTVHIDESKIKNQ